MVIMYKQIFIRVYVLCVCLFILGGCVNEPMPEVTYGPGAPAAPGAVVRPPSPKTMTPWTGFEERISSDWFPIPYLEKQWTAIIIHHSGTSSGNASIFDKWHREGNHWEGVGYDFVIGNGSDSANGQVETTFRWHQQKTGAHCGGTPGNWANRDGIGICLVGDFNRTAPTDSQMQALVRLVRFLQSRYGIPRSRIFGHGTAPGANATDCPGINFPMARLKSMLNF